MFLSYFLDILQILEIGSETLKNENYEDFNKINKIPKGYGLNRECSKDPKNGSGSVIFAKKYEITFKKPDISYTLT